MMQKSLYLGNSDYDHGTTEPIGVLLVNLGTPDAPTPEALRPYLRKFLLDPRVIEYARIPWWLILHLFILPTRPKRSAELYKRIWTPEGSPLLVNSEKQRVKLQAALAREIQAPIEVELGMRIGNPNIEAALERLRRKNVKQLLIIPMFPQYSSTTTGSVFDGVTEILRKWRRLPELRMVTTFHDDPGYIEALAASVRRLWDREGRPEKLVMSFHGMPKRYLTDGDPYFCLCHKTGRLLREALQLNESEAVMCFQSLFGREEWLRPYTDETLRGLLEKGVKKIDVICPAFSADCLETLEEVNMGLRELVEHGGGTFRYIPAVNDDDRFIDALSSIVKRNTGDWLQGAFSAPDEAGFRKKRANELRVKVSTSAQE